MKKIKREKCPDCGTLTVDGKHYSTGNFDPNNKYTNVKAPEWSDRDIRMVQKHDKKRKAGKETYYTYDEGTNMIEWLGKDNKKKQAYKITTDEYGNKTYHFRGKPK